MLQGENVFSGSFNLVMAAKGEGVVGWCSCRIIGFEAELLKIAVREKWRRQGVARHLLEGLWRQLANHEVERIFLEVRAANVPALSFYQKHGFLGTGIRSRYYQNPPDDAVLMEKTLLLKSKQG